MEPYFSRKLDIKIIDSLFDPDTSERVVSVEKKSASRPLYKVFVYLQGLDVPYVDNVTYTLHPTFKRPVIRVDRTISNPSCKLTIWTWGLFTIRASIATSQGTILNSEHSLTYDRDLQSPDIKYNYV